jgi:hypothetical protein
VILPKIDDERFIELVRRNTLIAFQRLEYGFAVAAPGEAYYAPMSHPGGGNLSDEFAQRLKDACLHRLSVPALRTLRPTAKPIPNEALLAYLRTAFFAGALEPMAEYPKAAGDHPAVVATECQVVIQAIEEHGRPDLKDAMRPLKREELSDALDLVIQHAESARELCEVSDEKPMLIKMYLLQSSTAMKSALEMLLQP